MALNKTPYRPALPDAMAAGRQHTGAPEYVQAALRRRRPYVLIVNQGGSREHGGMGQLVRYLTEAWRYRQDAPRATVLDSRGTGSIAFAPFFLAAALLTITFRRLIGRADLIHVNMAINTSVLRKGIVVFWSKLLGLPVILHLHAGLFIHFYDHLPWIASAFTRLVFRSADRTIVLGEVWRRMLIERLGVSESRIAVVHNGVAEAPPRVPAPPGSPCRLLYVGRVKADKGLAELFRALAAPALRDLPWTLKVVGNGDVGRFKAMADTLGLSAKVTFTGWLDRKAVQAAQSTADALVLPSYYEGLPLGVLEALSAGLAVLTTAVGAQPEILRDGETALLVPPRDDKALAAALVQLIQDPDLRARLGAAGRKLFRARFTVEHLALSIEAQYAVLLRAFAQRDS